MKHTPHRIFAALILTLLLWNAAACASSRNSDNPSSQNRNSQNQLTSVTPQSDPWKDRLVTTPQDRTIFENAIRDLAQYRHLPAADLLTKTARHFLGTPYVAGTLEATPDDPVINLHETDCILFVEMCTAITTLLKEQEQPTFDDYCRRIVRMRYREGTQLGYATRLHYTSEWIAQNSAQMHEITAQLPGSEKLPQQFYFMSRNADKYPYLQQHPEAIKEIAQAEQKLNQAQYCWIPAARLPAALDSIRSGDLIGFVSRVGGLDLTHVAIALRQNGQVRFIHASSKARKVIIDPKTLAQYCRTGIRLIRLK